ncbi:MAG TPA: hypothetical protein VNH44_18320 [Micropepsaceae bacterium]|nr:hypothetical protein [Micropepsaceae bacterium]
MKALVFLIGLVALSLSTPLAAQSTQSLAGTFVVVQGTINNAPATILLDSVNGKTWYLGQVDGQATWIPLPFAAKVPPAPPR